MKAGTQFEDAIYKFKIIKSEGLFKSIRNRLGGKVRVEAINKNTGKVTTGTWERESLKEMFKDKNLLNIKIAE